MAYDKEKIKSECIRVIREENITFFTELALYIEPTMATLYLWEFEKLEEIKAEIAKNRMKSKKKMRQKWEDSDSAPLQIAAYKLYADKEELESLIMNKVDQTNRYPEGVQVVLKKAE